MFLIAADPTWANLWGYAYIVKMAIGLGMVIFVHELGHFLAAKACGVKCEKFYIGFDVPMPKIASFQIPSKFVHFQWGETEYGIGIIPLGGYVKMLGQDDNPANAEKEAEKTRINRAATAGRADEPNATEETVERTSKSAQDEPAVGRTSKSANQEDATADLELRPTKEEDEQVRPAAMHHASVTDVGLEPQPLAEQVDYELDPRSYTAKNVPQRMLIISAGVIMNVIFAFVFATFAYRMGVPYTPSIVGSTVPGSPAWRANLPLGDRILQVGESAGPREHLRFGPDFSQQVVLDGKRGDIRLLMRDDLSKSKSTTTYTLKPDMKDAGWLLGKMPFIGVAPPATNKLADEHPLMSGFPAADTDLQGGDEIIAGIVGGKETEFANYWDMHAFLASHADDDITIKVKRTEKLDDGQEKTSIHEAFLKRRPLQRLGIVMTMGPITAIQKGSPAEAAGLRVGDVLHSVDGHSLGDPLTAPAIVSRLANKPVPLTVMRPGESGPAKPVEIEITPRVVRDYQSRVGPEEPMLVDSLGVTYSIENTIAAIDPDSDARGELQIGDEVVRVQVLPASDSAEDKKKLKDAGITEKELKLSDGKIGWPFVAVSIAQWLPEGAKIQLTVDRDGQEHTVELEPYDSRAYAFGARGLALTRDEEIHTAATWGEAASLGLRETKESLLLVVKFLKRLVNGDIPLTALGGPGTIAAAASSEASVSTSRLLIFLTMLSANLAVVNFLPIPVLDGGHMMFLLYEGIFRRPVNEVWQLRLSLLGFGFLLCLMAFVIGLDIYRFSPWGG